MTTPLHAEAMRRTSRIAILVALTLVAAKALVWLRAPSASLLASAADSCLDVLASGLNAWAIQHALEPPDRQHRYGHGKLESLAGLGQAVFVAVAAGLVAWRSVLAILEPAPLEQGGAAIAVMIFSIALTLWLVALQRRTAAMSGSRALAADALHYTGDLAQNAAVLLGIGAATYLDWLWVDGAVGAAVSLWILRSAWEVGAQSVQDLLDAEADDETRAALIAIIAADPGVSGLHDLRTRRSGPTVHATVHIEVDAAVSLRKAHRIAARVEQALLAEHPAGHFVLHVDPDDHEVEDPFGDFEDSDPVHAPALHVDEGEGAGAAELPTVAAAADAAER